MFVTVKMFSLIRNYVTRMRNLVPMEKRNKKVVFLFILLVTLLDNMNVSAAFVSTTDIQKKFGAVSTEVTWVVAAYALTLGSFIVLFGKIGDIIGVHNVFLFGAFFMALFSLIVAVIEKSIIALIIFRAFQGMSGAALIPSAYGLVANYFQGPELASAIRLLIIALTGSIGIGMILGGAFSETSIGYKGFYYFSFAIAFTSFCILFFIIIPVEESEARTAMKVKNLDFFACSGMVVGMLLVILGFTEGGADWKNPKAYVPLPIGVVILISVFLFEIGYIGRYKRMNPNSNNWKSKLLMIFPPEIIALPNFWVFLAAIMSIFLSYISCNLTLVQFHTYIEENSAILTAVKIFPIACGIVSMAVVFKFQMALKLGYKNCLMASTFIQTMMFVWVCQIDYKSSYLYWKYEFVPLYIYGAFCNVYFQVYLNVIMSSAPLHLQANVSGIFQTSAQIGISLGSAITSTFIGNISHATPKDVLQSRMSNALYMSVAASAASFFIVLFTNKSAYKPPAHLSTRSIDSNTSSQLERKPLEMKDTQDVEIQVPTNDT